MDIRKNTGTEFYAEHRTEVLEAMYEVLKKTRKGTYTSTSILFHGLYPDIFDEAESDSFLFQIHTDLLEGSRKHGLWLDLGEERFQVSGLPYNIQYAVRNVTDLTYGRQVKAAGLQENGTWKKDVRVAFEKAFFPVLESTEYYFVFNETDTTKKILELHKSGIQRRIMGFSGTGNMEINAFFNRDFYNRIRCTVDLPENKYPEKTQPHVTISLKTLWNVLCAATGQGMIAD